MLALTLLRDRVSGSDQMLEHRAVGASVNLAVEHVDERARDLAVRREHSAEVGHDRVLETLADDLEDLKHGLTIGRFSGICDGVIGAADSTATTTALCNRRAATPTRPSTRCIATAETERKHLSSDEQVEYLEQVRQSEIAACKAERAGERAAAAAAAAAAVAPAATTSDSGGGGSVANSSWWDPARRARGRSSQLAPSPGCHTGRRY